MRRKINQSIYNQKVIYTNPSLFLSLSLSLYIYIYIYISLHTCYYFIPCEFFKPASAGGFSLESECSKSLKVPVADLNTAVVCMISVVPLVSNSPSLFYKLLGTFSEHANNYCYHSPPPHVPQLFQLSGKIEVFVYLPAFFPFHSVVAKSTR